MKKVILLFCGILWATTGVAQASGGQIVRKKTPKVVKTPPKIVLQKQGEKNKTNQGLNNNLVQKQFVVTNAREFLDAIGSNREIIVQTSESIDLTDEMVNRINNGSVKDCKLVNSVDTGLYFDWRMTGPGIVLSGLKNLTITGSKNDTKLSVRSNECAVLKFIKCTNVRINQLVLTHNSGTCYGPILEISSCDSIYINSSDLLGSYTNGLLISNSKRFICEKTNIYNNSLNNLSIKGTSHNIHFSGCNFYNTINGFYVEDGSNDVVFKNCKIYDIKNNIFEKVGSKLLFENCHLCHNKDNSADMLNVVLKDCRWIAPNK